MFGSSGDTVLSCLVAAALVVVAHVIDGVGGRRRGSWSNSLALALCGLSLVTLAVSVVRAGSRTELLLLASTAVATCVSAIPLFAADDEPETTAVSAPPAPAPRPQPPRNPWDQTFRVRRNRVAELLGVPPRPAPTTAPTARRPDEAPSALGIATAPTATPATAPGTPTVMPGATATDPSPPRRSAFPEVDEAEETLNDVGQIMGDLGRLLGLGSDHPRRTDRS